jgi:hypothetical protein
VRFAAIGEDFPVFRLRYELGWKPGSREVRYIQAISEADARDWLIANNPQPVARILSCCEVSDFEARLNPVWFSGLVQQAAAA